MSFTFYGPFTNERLTFLQYHISYNTSHRDKLKFRPIIAQMHLDKYEIKSGEQLEVFEFISVGT